MNNERIFALDIGTRSVVGLILEQSGEQYKVVDLTVKEHKARAMQDGQIHDIVAVAEIISEVKTTLERQHGPLSKVCVAAAGRSLKTERAKAEVSIAEKPLLTQEDILFLELTAVQDAQTTAAKKQATDHFHTYYCVGYSVLHYFIDGEMIGNLIDQQGDVASVEIIATFLPRTVVDSLINALKRAGLELEALTLEPIAAINVLVPVSMRRLNVALVDIGAGTSDIAITNEGTVIAYGMVPTAGDEITEAVSDELLLDFPDAEQAKRQLWQNDKIIVQDILGFETEINKSDVVTQISPAIDKLAEEIRNEIIELNNGVSPKAVMLVGGGSMTPELTNRLSRLLNLPDNRVAIRGADAIQGLTFPEHISGGPENITPIGIAISARKSPIQYVSFTINDRLTHMFAVKKLTIADCLLAAGISIGKLYGKPGMAMFVTLNDQPLTIPGTYGGPPVILKNGVECSLEDSISDGDQIHIQNGKDGEKSKIKIRELIDEIPEKTAIINGKPYEIQTAISKNGKRSSLDEWIDDGDHISVSFPETISELLKALNLNELSSLLQPFMIKLNGKEMFFPHFSGEIWLNGKEVKGSHSLPNKLELTIVRKLIPTVRNLATLLQHSLAKSITVFYNDEQITMTNNSAEYYRNGTELDLDEEIHFGEKIEYKQKPSLGFIFQDIFKYVAVEKPDNASGNFSLKINDEEATFYSSIKDGDRLEIIWPVVIK
ncbi:cell division protein FtsA [Bacillus niameyensis]|uniref:cell division protein FtsA n=1 Tax=Bacillus niameyensis TaxID=1522308 RepID=UPI000783B3BD|nr:cell division protein FtsA [Bacillus niameyensis]